MNDDVGSDFSDGAAKGVGFSDVDSLVGGEERGDLGSIEERARERVECEPVDACAEVVEPEREPGTFETGVACNENITIGQSPVGHENLLLLCEMAYLANPFTSAAAARTENLLDSGTTEGEPPRSDAKVARCLRRRSVSSER